MVDKMTFPDTLEEFVEQYKVVDTDGIYMSKGSELVPIFRIKQWCDHIFAMTRPEQCQDTISRQAVIDALHIWFADGFNEDRWWNSTHVLAAIEGAPSVQHWIPFKCRDTTDDDCTSFDYIMEGHLPEDGQTILITVKPDGHEPVQVDTYYGGGGEECYLDSGYTLCDEAIAWMPLPEPYKAEDKNG